MDPSALLGMLGGAASGGSGISREQAQAFAQMAAMAGQNSGATPAAPAAPAREPTPEELEAEKERYIQGYAQYLEQLKKQDPEEYKAIMKELQQAAQQAKAGFEPVMPGGDKKLGADGINSAKQEEGIEVTPKPGFVIKTSNTKTGAKVFINVCHSSVLKKPSKKKQLQPDGTEQEGLNIPLSLGPPCPITTKKGEKAMVFDCIVNTAVVEEAAADRTGGYRHFVCELCIHYVDTKYKTSLNQQYKLPQSKYKGLPVRTQMIRKRQAPTIEEVEEPSSASGASKKSAARRSGGGRRAGGRASKKAQQVIRIREPDEPAKHSVLCRDAPDGALYKWESGDDEAGRQPVQVVVRVLLTKMPDDEQPRVDLAEELLLLKATGHHPLELYLPVPIDANSEDITVTLDRGTGALEVVLPVNRTMAEGPSAGPDMGSKPWLLSQALNVGNPDPASGPRKPSKPGVNEPGASTSYGSAGAPVREDDTLPEDRFHKADIVSSHLLMERAKDRAERKKKQAEKDAKEAAEKKKQEEEEAAKKEADEIAAREAAIAAAAADVQDDDDDGDLVLSSGGGMALDLID